MPVGETIAVAAGWRVVSEGFVRGMIEKSEVKGGSIVVGEAYMRDDRKE